MKNYNKGQNLSKVYSPPNQDYLDILQIQALKIGELAGSLEGEKLIIEGLGKWPELIRFEVHRFQESMQRNGESIPLL
ncbi:hypothetical protein SMI01S_06680 [Sphingobacterium mizutaii NBRC 14946 = DSM 11724]|uniref:Uncharacterized protein n=2 Tax=Sphingobacterium mizutaii TaxID=1010 RepID=A0AAJ4XAN7_9SPHI|nr:MULTISPECIES: hypothetical protein [Sphingobacterium]GEM67062.1 hypothetical protein SMI01S_06680 [Sphingobacterium mizutaii NBRC 14946 = DSM 11724]SDK95924.1 hypothetical protein SAMN05192578_101527 [Sphingobacterium mizutaii]SNV48906.1 Uncharacterised protein [Sphingobacterium mizutaii]